MNIIEKSSVTEIIIALAIFGTIAVSWVVNIYKLTQCDFASPYKGEIIHAVGLVPICAPFTVWCDDK